MLERLADVKTVSDNFFKLAAHDFEDARKLLDTINTDEKLSNIFDM